MSNYFKKMKDYFKYTFNKEPLGIIELLFKALANRLNDIESKLKWIYKQAFIHTADEKYLIQHGYQLIERRAATKASGYVFFKGSLGSFLKNNIELSFENNKYITLNSSVIVKKKISLIKPIVIDIYLNEINYFVKDNFLFIKNIDNLKDLENVNLIFNNNEIITNFQYDNIEKAYKVLNLKFTIKIETINLNFQNVDSNFSLDNKELKIENINDFKNKYSIPFNEFEKIDIKIYCKHLNNEKILFKTIENITIPSLTKESITELKKTIDIRNKVEFNILRVIYKLSGLSQFSFENDTIKISNILNLWRFPDYFDNIQLPSLDNIELHTYQDAILLEKLPNLKIDIIKNPLSNNLNGVIKTKLKHLNLNKIEIEFNISSPVFIESLETGLNQNLDYDTDLNLDTPLANVDLKCKVSSLNKGNDLESLENYRQNLINFFRNPQAPFTKVNIIFQIKKYFNNIQYIWFKEKNNPYINQNISINLNQKLEIYILNYNLTLDLIDISLIENLIQSIKPLNVSIANIYIKQPIIIPFDLNIKLKKPKEAVLKKEIENEIIDYFKILRFETPVLKNNIKRIIESINLKGLLIENYEVELLNNLNEPVENINLIENSILKLNNLRVYL